MGKIKTIHDSLADHLRYNPHSMAKGITESVYISFLLRMWYAFYKGMPTKGCQSDEIPTSLLKEILLALAPSLAKIFNISLKHGIFTSH